MQGLYDQAAGSAQQALGHARGVVASGAASVAKAARTAAGETANTDLETRIQKNPWGAVAIALGVGILVGKMS